MTMVGWLFIVLSCWLLGWVATLMAAADVELERARLEQRCPDFGLFPSPFSPVRAGLMLFSWPLILPICLIWILKLRTYKE